MMLLYANKLEDNSRHYIFKYEIISVHETYFRYFREGRAQAHKKIKAVFHTFSVTVLSVPNFLRYTLNAQTQIQTNQIPVGKSEIMFSTVVSSEDLQLGAVTKD